MKKIKMIAALVVLITTSAYAQKLNASKVPAVVKTAFTKQYPGTVAKWELEDGKYEASFKQNGSSMSVIYEANGTMTESEIGIKVSELPATAVAYVKEHYKGKTIQEGAKITKADGTINYEAELKGKDIVFDANGKFLKEVKD